MSRSTSAGWSRRPRAGCVTAFLESFFERYVEYDFTAALEEKLDEISDGKLAWKDVLRDFWRISRRRRRHQGTARHRRARRAERGAGAAGLPGARGRLRPAHLPEMRHRQPVAEARQIRRLRRLLELSGMQLHPPARRRATAMARPAAARTARRCSARTPTPARRSRCAAAASAPMCSAATARRPSARACPRAGPPTASTTRRRWRCCRCRAMSASIPRPAR